MLLREFTVNGYTINLTQDGTIYIATVKNEEGEKVFYHEYNDYQKIKNCLNEIISKLDDQEVNIKDILVILEHSMI